MRSSRRRGAASQGRWKKIALWLCAALVVLAVVGVIVAKLAIENYLHSEGFRSFVSQKSSQTLHAEAQFEPFSISGMTFYSDAFSAQGSERAAFAKIRLDQVRAEVSARRFFDQVWDVDSVSAQRLDIRLDGARVKLPVAAASEGQPAAQSTEGTPGEGWLPNRVEVKTGSVRDTNVTWGGPGMRGGFIKGVRLEALAHDGGWNVEGEGGTLEIAGIPAFNFSKLQFRFKAPSALVQVVELRQPASGNGVRDGNGVVRVDGEVRMDDSLDLHLNLESLTVTPLLPYDWRARLHGNLSGTLDTRAKLPSLNGLVTSGKLTLSDGQLEALPVLDQIAAFTMLPQYRRLTLSKASAEVRQEGDKLTVKNLLLESVGLIRMEGDFTVVNGMIEGAFMVGVTPSSLQWLPGAQERVFTQARDGYLWAPMRLTGPVISPKEDLTERLKAAAAGAVTDRALDAVRGGVDASKDAAKGVKGVIDLVSPLLKLP